MSWESLRRKHLPPCTYCGEPADTRDHVPPKVVAPFNRKTVPACHRCNCSILLDKFLITVEERRAYVLKVLRRQDDQLSPRPVPGLGPS